MTSEYQVQKLRIILRTGSFVFGLSALILIAIPSFFNELLGFSSTSELNWTMRMIGVTLIALTGNMYSVATRGSTESVIFSGKVMLVSAFGLGVMTLLIPVPLTWFTISYALVGFSFSAAYGWILFNKK